MAEPIAAPDPRGLAALGPSALGVMRKHILMKKHLVVFFQLVPVILSSLFIGAHFLRAGNLVLVAISVVLPCCLFIRHPLTARLMQLALLLSTIEWVHVGLILTSSRSDAGLPWGRLAIILGAVALLSFASIFVFYAKALKDRYNLERKI